jgi:hypothetical protein
MEIPGEVFLFNFSLLAITFSAVSAVVMLLRQTMGGKLSNFDVFLVNAYVAHGFVLAIAAILPPLIAQFELPLNVVFVISSVIAALLMTLKSGNTMIQRKSITKSAMPISMVISFSAQWITVLILLLNAVIPDFRGVALFELGLTISLATIMWAFVRRVSTLVSDHASEDWDPKRG